MSTPHEVARECAALRRRMAEAQALADQGKHAEAYGYLRAGAGILLAHVEPGLQAGSGEQRTGAGDADVAGVRSATSTDHASTGARAIAAPAAGEGTSVDLMAALVASLKPVSDAEAEAVADAACGAPVDSHVSRAYVGPGPERLKARFRW